MCMNILIFSIQYSHFSNHLKNIQFKYENKYLKSKKLELFIESALFFILLWMSYENSMKLKKKKNVWIIRQYFNFFFYSMFEILKNYYNLIIMILVWDIFHEKWIYCILLIIIIHNYEIVKCLVPNDTRNYVLKSTVFLR